MSNFALYQLEVRNPSGEIFSGKVTFNSGPQRAKFQLHGAKGSLIVIARTLLDAPNYRICWIDLPDENLDHAVIFHLGKIFQPFYQATGTSVANSKFIRWRAIVKLLSAK